MTDETKGQRGDQPPSDRSRARRRAAQERHGDLIAQQDALQQESHRRRFAKALDSAGRLPGWVQSTPHRQEVMRDLKLHLIDVGWAAVRDHYPRPVWMLRVVLHLMSQTYVESHVESCETCEFGEWAWLLASDPKIPSTITRGPTS